MEGNKKKRDRVESGCLLELIWNALDGKECLKLLRILEEAEKRLFKSKRKMYLLLFQATLFSAKEEVGLLLQLFGNII
ncbi:hypothetical protein [Thermococcus sp.]|uniref:hypothetical protein n=1 Tax=Thermococcus sp. TaxID=35749 RepID=UPI0026139C32|nr:hypothetical protein [Thermococcus sp.]